MDLKDNSGNNVSVVVCDHPQEQQISKKNNRMAGNLKVWSFVTLP
jgi:hypothetical protein